MKRFTSIRTFLLVALSILSLGCWTAAVDAFPMKYIFNGVGSFGDVSLVPFDDATMKIILVGDSTQVSVVNPLIPTLPVIRASIVLSGPGLARVGTFTNPTTLFVNHTLNTIGFSSNPLFGDLLDLHAPNVGLNTYGLTTSLGPVVASDLIAGTSIFSSQFGAVPTSIGLVTLDEANEVQFTATPFYKELTDFDGDYKADVAVFRPSNGGWYVRPSTGLPAPTTVTYFGTVGDTPLSEDFDGDGKTDLAVWRPSNGYWYIRNSSTGLVTFAQFGMIGDVLVPSDYDGDGKADLAVWRPSNGYWYIRNSSTGLVTFVQFGMNGDVPVDGDYDGDGRADIAIWRPSTGTWFIIRSGDGIVMYNVLGTAADTPVPADYDGDGLADTAVFQPATGTWLIRSSLTGAVTATIFGIAGDIPVPGDYDGDGIIDIAVWRPSNGFWYVRNSSTGLVTQTQWGLPTDIPIGRF